MRELQPVRGTAMRRAIVLTTLGVLALISAAAAEGPKLVKPKLLVADDGTDEVFKSMHSARLSPDGKHLLYMRVKQVALPARDGRPARKRRFYRLILRDLKTGKDKPLPIPAYMDDEIAVCMLSANIFATGGGRIALGAGIGRCQWWEFFHQIPAPDNPLYSIWYQISIPRTFHKCHRWGISALRSRRVSSRN